MSSNDLKKEGFIGAERKFGFRNKAKKGQEKAKKESLSGYTYTAHDAAGEKKTGSVSAYSYSEAKLKLEHDGLRVERLQLKKPWYLLEFGRVVPLSVLLVATRQLASFAQSGIPLSQGIKVLAQSSENKKMRQSLEEVHLEIESGNTFSEALQHQPGIYPVYYTSIINAAERTGDVTKALETLSEYLERDLRSQRAVKSALYYPIVLIFIGMLAAILMSVYVLPRFEVFFSQLNSKLPLTTRMLLAVTHFIGRYWWIGVILLIASASGYAYASRKPAGKFYLDRLKLKMPLFGSLFELVALERFCRVLATLVTSNVPLPDALDMSGKATGNRVYQVQLEQVKQDVINGEGLAQPLSKTTVFPDVAIQIFKVGEDSGQLSGQLVQASGFYSDELDYRMKNFTSLIEPVVLLIIGTVVGFISVALISAMYGIYSGVNG